MNLALNLLGLLLTAALVENPFYTRCFMAETVDAQLNERRDVMLRSIIAAGMCLPGFRAFWGLCGCSGGCVIFGKIVKTRE